MGSVSACTSPCRCSIAAQPERATGARAVAQAEARADAFQASLRAQIAALRDDGRSNGAKRRIAIAPRRQRSADQLERIAQVSYEAGERGILELLDALSKRRRRAHASGGAGCRRASGGDRARIRQRMGDSVMTMKRLVDSDGFSCGVLPSCGAARPAQAPARQRPRRSTSRAGPTRRSCSWSIRHSWLGRRFASPFISRRLADFSALNAGRPGIEMTPESGGAPVTLARLRAIRPGVFRVEGQLPPAGQYRWALS